MRRAASVHQHRFWVEWRRAPDDTAYQPVYVHRIRGDVDVARLHAAFDAVAQRHEALRSTHHAGADGRLALEVHDRLPVPLHAEQGAVGDEEAETAFVRRVQAMPMDLERASPLRLCVLSGDGAHLVVLVAHHVAFDGASIPRFYAQLSEVWAALRAGRPAPDALVPSLVAWLDEVVPFEQSLAYEAAVDFWVQRLSEGPRDVQVAAFVTASDVPQHAIDLTLPPARQEALRSLAGARRATVFEVLAASWLALLHRVTGEPDVVVSYPVRATPKALEGLVACFVNNLPLRARVEPETTFAALVDQVHAERDAGRRHERANLLDVVRRLRSDGVLGADEGLLSVGFAQTHLRSVPLALEGLEVEPVPPPPAGPIWDLVLEYERAPGLPLRLSARADRFPRWFVEGLARAWAHLAGSLLDAPDAPVRAAPWLVPEERQRVLYDWNDTWTAYPRDRSVADLFDEVAERFAPRVAVEAGARSLTYAALAARARGVAAALHERLGGAPAPGTVVALAAPPGIEAVVGLVGIVLAGCAYLPLRRDDPPERVAGMLEDAGAVAILATSGWAPPLDLLVLDPGEVPPADETPPRRAGATDPLYVLYTSGSTGRPKGALVPHRGVVRLVRGTDWIALSPDDRLLQSSDLAFDGATFDLWGALLNGGAVVCPDRADLLEPARLAALLERGRISVTFLTAGLFHLHAAADPSMFGGLRVLLAGGDVVDPRAVASVLSAAPRPRVFLDAYGPTENTTYSTIGAFAEPPDPHAPLPIGPPVSNTTAYVVDRGDEPVPVGVPGELLLGGDGVALGYLGRPDLTAERFVDNPFTTDADRAAGRNAVLYRTGDRVRWLPDGRLDFLGRLDAQVKLRGYRVEPGEVDARARAHPGVEDAATVVARQAAGPALVCWYVPRGALEPDALRAWLAEGLPDYLVPVHLGPIDALPVNRNGKVDRAALVARGLPRTAVASGPPSTATERLLARLWSDLLGVSSISVEDGFFRLGGDSLLAIELAGRVRRELGRDLSVDDVFRHPRLGALAAHLERLAPADVPEPVASGTPVPPTLPLSHFQLGHWFLLRRGLAYQTVLVLRIGAALDPEALDAAVAALVARHEVFRLEVDRRRPRMVRQPVAAVAVAHRKLPEAEADRRPAVAAEVAREVATPRTGGATLTAWTGPDETWLALVMPHALTDGFGLEVLARELIASVQGRALPDPPLPLHDYLAWEARVISPSAIDAGCAFYEERLVGDATVRIPRRVLGGETTGAVGTLDPAAVARLAGLARRLDTSLESVLAWCAFLAVHLGFRSDLVRCLSAYNNRDLVALRGLPFMLANGLWQQSRLEPGQSFSAAAAAFATARAETFRHARLPPLVFFATSRLLFLRGTLAHVPGAAFLGRSWARWRPGRSWRLGAYVVDLVVLSAVYQAWRAWIGWSRSETVRTTGCFVNVTTSLTEPPAFDAPWPVELVRLPVDVPETIPGNPMLELYRDRAGVRVLFQGRYAPGRTDAFVALVEAVVREAAAAPDAPLGTLRERLAAEASAFLG